MERIEVDANTLREVLNAINGPAHYIRELQVTRGLPGSDDPIGVLVDEFNKAVEQFNAKANVDDG